MIALVVRGIVAELLWRSAKVLAGIVLGALLLEATGGCVANHAITVELLQPGGAARLGDPRVDLSLAGATEVGGPGIIGPSPSSTMLPAPPAEQWAAMVAAATAAPCAFPGPQWLAAIAFYESDYGANPGPSSAGAWGYGQFMPASFVQYGILRPEVGNPSGPGNDYHVMLPAMVAKLCGDGIAQSIDRALLAYNDSLAYVAHIKALVASWSATIATSGPAWHDLPAFNQYDPRSWANPTNYQVWASAACSAAALDWLLTAYGHPPGLLDAAVALIGPYTGISPTVGLLDHTGPALAQALGRAGFTAWRQQLSGQTQLRQRLQQGPAMLDGQRWFGVGHWFVAVGADDSGVTVRESSGHNIQFLSWARLFGEVGWSGWAVGIGSAATSNQA